MAGSTKKEWVKPFVGYSNTKSFCIEKISFSGKQTAIDVVVSGRPGAGFSLSSTSQISAGGRLFRINSVKGLELDSLSKIGDSGQKRFTMLFPAVPEDTEVLHFVEGDSNNYWKICNISKEKKKSDEQLPQEWQNICYTACDSLPISRMSKDYSTIRVKVMNYVPEMGAKIAVRYYSIGRRNDHLGNVLTSPISDDGVAEIKVQLLYPCGVELWMKEYDSYYNGMWGTKSDVIVTPGENLDVLMNANMPNDSMIVAFKGSNATVNYELNCLGARNLIGADLDSVAVREVKACQQETEKVDICRKKYLEYHEMIEKSPFCDATKEWLRFKAEERIFYLMWECRIEKKYTSTIASLMSDTSCHWSSSPAFMNFMYESLYINTMYREHGTVAKLLWLDKLIKRQYSSPERNTLTKENIDELINENPELKEVYLFASSHIDDAIKEASKHSNMHVCTEYVNESSKLKSSLLSTYRGRKIIVHVWSIYDGMSLRDMNDLEAMMKELKDAGYTVIHVSDARGVEHWYETSLKYGGEHYYWSRAWEFDEFKDPRYAFPYTQTYEVYDEEGRSMFPEVYIKTADQLKKMVIAK